MVLQIIKTTILVFVLTTQILMLEYVTYQQELDNRDSQGKVFGPENKEDSKEYDYNFGFIEFGRNRPDRNLYRFQNFFSDKKIDNYWGRHIQNIKSSKKHMLKFTKEFIK